MTSAAPLVDERRCGRVGKRELRQLLMRRFAWNYLGCRRISVKSSLKLGACPADERFAMSSNLPKSNGGSLKLGIVVPLATCHKALIMAMRDVLLVVFSPTRSFRGSSGASCSPARQEVSEPAESLLVGWRRSGCCDDVKVSRPRYSRRQPSLCPSVGAERRGVQVRARLRVLPRRRAL